MEVVNEQILTKPISRNEYKQTELGLIPYEWDVKKLGEVSNIKTGPFGSSLHERDYVSDGTPIITVEHLGELGIIPKSMPMVSDTDKKRLSSYILQTDDIVFSRVGSVDRNSIVNKKEQGWLFSGRLLRIRVESRNIFPKYLSYYFHQESFKQRIRNVAVGQTMASLNTQILKEIEVVVPIDFTEQTAIATALSDTDDLINSLEKLIEKKRNIKQGAMQKLLQPKEGWKVKKLGDLGKTFGGLSGKSKIDFTDGKYPYIPFMNIMSNPIIDTTYLGFVNIKNGENQNAALKGDLFFNGSSETPEEVGMCSVLLEDVPNLYLNSFCFGFRLNYQLKNNGLYLSYYLRSSEGRKLFFSMAQGATRYNLSKNNFNNLEISLPKPEEQNSIATILSDMDNEISALENKLEKYREIKVGMMQNLLTGKIRLV